MLPNVQVRQNDDPKTIFSSNVKDDPKTSTNEAWTYTGPTYMWIAHAVEDKIKNYLKNN